MANSFFIFTLGTKSTIEYKYAWLLYTERISNPFFLSQKFKSQIQKALSFLPAQVITQFMSMYSCEEASLGALALETAALLPEAIAEALKGLEAAVRST